jgi:Probable lipoprotein LpqN
MIRASRTKAVTVVAVVIGLGVAGCGSDTATEATKSPETSVQVTNPNPAAGPMAPPPGAPPAPAPAAPPAALPAGHHYTIVDFIRDNRIVETQLHPGDPGAPIVNLPTPPGWTDAGDTTPVWAWRAIYFTDPAMAADPPNIVTLVSKLTGKGTDRALAYAPGELRNMTDFEGDAGTAIKVSGFNAFQLGGTFTRNDGVKRAIVQTTVEIPAPDGVLVMQSNADGTPEQLGLLRDTMRIVDEQTTITPP